MENTATTYNMRISMSFLLSNKQIKPSPPKKMFKHTHTQKLQTKVPFRNFKMEPENDAFQKDSPCPGDKKIRFRVNFQGSNLTTANFTTIQTKIMAGQPPKRPPRNIRLYYIEECPLLSRGQHFPIPMAFASSKRYIAKSHCPPAWPWWNRCSIRKKASGHLNKNNIFGSNT